ncbi:MAG: molybdopterin-guanine dinucleotide biosynthesis protein B [Methylotenera sp.]|nr:molybdopterin-guanine dinucleotide biosynthesis protein B [Methylotenera sp.]
MCLKYGQSPTQNLHSTQPLPIIGICAASSKVGKTTLITQLIPALAKRNIRVSVIKHTHHQFDIDYPGKDSYKIREAGAAQTLIASNKRWALMTELTHNHHAPHEVNQQDESLEALVRIINPNYADLILVEGFKSEPIPKIEVYRPSLNMPLLAALDPSVIAVASDEALSLNIPVLALNDIEQIVDFILVQKCF